MRHGMSRNWWKFTICAVAAVGVSLAGCTAEDEDDFEATRADFRSDLETRLSEVERELAELRDSAEDAGDDVSEGIEESIEELEETAQNLESKLDEIGNQTRDTWDDWKASIEVDLDT